ncbi:unnamed protein product, partial [Candidula unifasciata]
LGANVLALRFTCRKVVFIGGVLSGLGFILSTFVEHFDLLYLTFAVITGLGYALSYSPCVVMVGLHFKKRRSLANGISVSGSGVGSFVVPNLIRWLLNLYGLPGCLLILGGLTLNVSVCALLIRPLSSYKKRQPELRYTELGVTKDAGFQQLLNTQICESLSGNNGQASRKESLSKNFSEFSSNELIPMASLQNIPQEELKDLTSSVCDCCKCCDRQKSSTNRSHKKTQKLFDWSLMSNPLFIIYALSCGFGNFAYPNVFLMLPAHAENNGQDRNTAALLVSIIGITDLIGRLFFGWFSDLKLMPRLLNRCSVMATFPALVTYAALYGLFAGSYMALISVMLADVLGVEKLSSAYGLVMLVMSVGLLPGPLICGQRTARYYWHWNYSFVLCGVLALIGSIPPLFEPCAKQYVDAREAKKINVKAVTKSLV